MNKEKLYGYAIALVLSLVFVSFVIYQSNNLASGVAKSVSIQAK